MDSEAKQGLGKWRWIERGIVAATCALVIGLYAYTAHSGFLESLSQNAADAYYNLLVQGFRAGHLSLKKEPMLALTHLADPYDPAASSRSSLLDVSYYKGKLYLYFGITPAVVLFWPYVALTGQYLFQKDGAMIFCSVGFLVSVGLLYALWRRYFVKVDVWVVAAGILALGLATFTPFLLAQSDVYETSISCGYAFMILALAAIWKALHEPSRRGRWLAAASLAYGLAVGARPSLLFGAVILMVPVVQAWRERGKVWALLMAATGPIVLIGLGLMLYNALRFDSPFEFGTRYQLMGNQRPQQFFSPRYLWFNFRVYFLELARWDGRFPFVHDIRVPQPLPAGYVRVERAFGILTNIPLVWLALALPLAWRDRSTESRSILCGFLTGLGVLFGICALTICLYCSANTRYEVEFLPTLVLLAVIGMLSLESALACRPGWRRAARCGCGLLLGFSVAFNLLASVGRCGEAHSHLGFALERRGNVPEAIAQYEQALRLNPDLAEVHRMLGNHLLESDRVPEAITHYEQTIRLDPDWAEAHNNLGTALMQMGKLPEAAEHFKQALRIIPDLAEAHNNLAVALMQMGKLPEALEHFEQALRSRPDDAETHYDLGRALEEAGSVQEATVHYEEALRLKPDLAEAKNGLARLRTAQ